MPRFNDMYEKDSKYLKQSDITGDVLVTIQGFKKVNVALENEEPQIKWVVKFEEFPKPMVLNSTNIQLMQRACGEESSENCIGKQITIYVDENVSFQGKLVGGLRIRAKKPAAKAESDPDDWTTDTPF